MKKFIGSFLAIFISLALMGYSVSRSLHFIGMTLPPDRQILAWFGIAALDGGLVAWLINYLYGAKGGPQRGISLMMVIVDCAGSVVMFTLDTLLVTGNEGMTVAMTPEEIQAAVLALSAIIAINIGATVAHLIYDPDNRRRMAAEEAQDAIEDGALKLIDQNTPAYAAQYAPVLANNFAEELKALYASAIKRRAGKPMLAEPEAPEVAGNLDQEEPANPTKRRTK